MRGYSGRQQKQDACEVMNHAHKKKWRALQQTGSILKIELSLNAYLTEHRYRPEIILAGTIYLSASTN